MPANILIVDDSAVMRGMIRRTLERSGLDVGEIHEAANGIEALAAMASGAIHAVLLDIGMPLMDGAALVARIRDDARLRGVPVIIASTEGSETRIEELLAAGARGYVRKPFRPEQIRDVLAPIVGLRAEPLAAPASAVADDADF